MSSSRRNFFQDAMLFGAGLFGLSARLAAAASAADEQSSSPSRALRESARPNLPCPWSLPTSPICPLRMDGATKVFRLKAAPLKQKIVPVQNHRRLGLQRQLLPVPPSRSRKATASASIVENALPESTSMHWHGLEVPIEQDGVPLISQKPIAPGETYTYEFTVHQEGTFFYHAHSAMQEMIGLIGMFIAHPQNPHTPHVDHDFGIVLQEWAVLPNNSVPNTANMEFNWLTMNGVAAPMPPRRSSSGSAAACVFVSSISAWIITPSISTATSSSSPAPKAAARPNPPGIPPTPFSSASRKPRSSNSKPNIPAHG